MCQKVLKCFIWLRTTPSFYWLLDCSTRCRDSIRSFPSRVSWYVRDLVTFESSRLCHLSTSCGELTPLRLVILLLLRPNKSSSPLDMWYYFVPLCHCLSLQPAMAPTTTHVFCPLLSLAHVDVKVFVVAPSLLAATDTDCHRVSRRRSTLVFWLVRCTVTPTVDHNLRSLRKCLSHHVHFVLSCVSDLVRILV